MTIIELERELLQLGISDDLYSIMTGGLPNEKLCIVKEDKWQVYYSERGVKTTDKHFNSESEACQFILRKLVPFSVLSPDYKK